MTIEAVKSATFTKSRDNMHAPGIQLKAVDRLENSQHSHPDYKESHAKTIINVCYIWH